MGNSKWLDVSLIIGKKYNRLTVLSVMPSIIKNGKYKRCVSCVCECGNIKSYKLNDVIHGRTKSCGCYKAQLASERIKKRCTTHGGVGSKEYDCWHAMKMRCTSTKNISYKNYGGRVITVSDEWINSFQNFITDMGKKPSPSHSIERVDNEKGYSKENCVWATRSEQNKNRRITTKIEYNGEVRSITQWSRLYNINIGTLRRRLLVLGYPIEKALIK